MSQTTLIALSLVLVAGACSPKSPTASPELAPAAPAEPAEPAAPEVAAPTEDPAAIAKRMHEHLLIIGQVKDAAIAGDLGRIKEAARPLAEAAEQTTLPDTWTPHVREVDLQAKRVMEASDLAAAARGVSLMAERCGSCHVDAGARVALAPPGEPPAASGTSAHMLRHQWALDRLWEGLVGPDDARWVAGAEALADAPLRPTDATDAKDVNIAEIARLADAAHALAATARQAARDARAGLYADLLVTCQGCHTLATRAPAGTTSP